MPRPTIDDLRRNLRKKFPGAIQSAPHPAAENAPLPFPAPCQADFPQRGISEVVVGPAPCGHHLLLASLIDESPAASGTATPELALIDGRDQFDPCSFPDSDCAKILWLRCESADQALKATDLLLHDGNLPRLVLDLSAYPNRQTSQIPISIWHRFNRLIESNACGLIVFTPRPLIPCCHKRASSAPGFTLDHLDWPRRDLLRTLRATMLDDVEKLHKIN